MTLQAVPPISLTDVYAEYSAPLGTPLSAFLRNGAWVPDTPTNAGVPTVLPITLLDLLGSSVDPAGDLFVMTAGTDAMSGDTGYDDNNGYGSITPTAYLGGFYEVLSLENGNVFVVRIAGVVLAANAFTSVQFLTGANWAGETFLTADATYDNPGGGADSRWEWVGSHADFVVGNDYDVSMVT